MPESLRAVIVRHTDFADRVEDAFDIIFECDVRLADQNAETIPFQVARLQLICVPGVFEQLQAVAVDFLEVRFGMDRNGNPLPRDGVAVLQPGRADVAHGDTQLLSEHPREVFWPNGAFFEPEIEMLPGAARRIRGDFFDFKILHLGANATAHARNIVREHGRIDSRMLHGTVTSWGGRFVWLVESLSWHHLE